MRANFVCVNSVAYCKRDNSVSLTRVNKVVSGQFSTFWEWLSKLCSYVLLWSSAAREPAAVLLVAACGYNGEGGMGVEGSGLSSLWNALLQVNHLCKFFFMRVIMPKSRCLALGCGDIMLDTWLLNSRSLMCIFKNLLFF